MNELRPDTVVIHQLHVRQSNSVHRNDGVSSAATQLQKTVQRLQREIEWADWPQAPGNSWVFIRELSASAPQNELVRTLLQDVHNQLHGGSTDNVVRFADLSELLSSLLIDLWAGKAHEQWHWKSWSNLFRLPPAEAIATLLSEHIAHLAAVCSRLAARHSLQQLWFAMDEPAAQLLLQNLAWRISVPIPETTQIEADTAIYLHGEPTRAPLRISSSLLAQWSPILRNLPLRDMRHRLALFLIGQEIAPLMLRQAASPLLAQLHVTLTDLRPHPDADQTLSPADSGVQVTLPQPSSPTSNKQVIQPPITTTVASTTPLLAQQTDISAANPASDSVCQPATAPTTGDIMQRQQQSMTPPPAAETTQTHQLDPADNLHIAPPPSTHFASSPLKALRLQPPPFAPLFDQLHTRQGGLFYLLNFLNRPEPQALMADNWQLLPSGWSWLYLLGKELNLEESDSLVPFIAAQLGFESPAQLQELPPLPQCNKLLELAQRWYGRHELWQHNLLQLNATLRSTPSHIDLYASLSEIKLAVRLAGLDINPGWLPWLGRVVTFHYN